MGCIVYRYIITILGSIGLGIVYGLRVNLFVAIVSMINHTAVHNQKDVIRSCGRNISVEAFKSEDGPFAWSTTVQGLILSSYFWGYIVSQLPAGRVSETFSAKWVMFFSVAINIVCTLLSPMMAQLHYGALIAMRIAEGIGGGCTFPTMHVMLAHWAPPDERTVMSAVVYSGTSIATVIFLCVSGTIAVHLSWEAVFYIEGAVCAIWMIFWCLLVSDTPDQQKYMSEEEKNYITESLGHGITEDKKHLKVPWKTVLTSKPFLAILFTHAFSNWGFYIVLVALPLFMKTILGYQLHTNSLLVSLPFLGMWLFGLVLCKTLQTLCKKQIITTTTARKIGSGCASIVPGLCFIPLAFESCNRTLAVSMMVIAGTFLGGAYCGFLANHIDIAPNFAGTLMAITNTIATICGIVVPVLTGQLVAVLEPVLAWKVVFWITVGMFILATITYLIFASAEEQEWNQV